SLGKSCRSKWTGNHSIRKYFCIDKDGIEIPGTVADSYETLKCDNPEFQCKGKFYRQIHGTAMGSQVSVVISNLVMEELE
ncbi:hypothetical protein QZH41_008993, partial [Actinostola sp. cb2023]